MEALTRAVSSGKTRYIGFSEWPVDKVQAALDLTRGSHVAKFVSSQPQYSLLWREPEEELIPLCAANGISQIVWSPLGQGVLSGKYDPDRPPPTDSRAASQEMGGFIGRLMEPPVLRAVQQLKPIAEEAGLTLPQFALAWVLREPNVASAIIGASRPEQVRENAAASGVIVDTQLFMRAEAMLDEALRGVETA
jgi:aryl-alcohol dehydrogenase-like predicted oxidoreductase